MFQQHLSLQWQCVETSSLISGVFIQLLFHQPRLLWFQLQSFKSHYEGSKLGEHSLIQGEDIEPVIAIMALQHCFCLPLPPFLSSDGEKFGEMAPSRPLVFQYCCDPAETCFKSLFLSMCPCMLLIFLLCIMNSGLHAKSWNFVKLSTPKKQNEAIYFHVQVSLNILFMREISTFATQGKRINFAHWARKC